LHSHISITQLKKKKEKKKHAINPLPDDERKEGHIHEPALAIPAYMGSGPGKRLPARVHL
jgi:hypothetical protein